MTTITIVEEDDDAQGAGFRARGRDRESVGRTRGAALDALTAQFDLSEAGSLLIVVEPRPDEFFTAAQLRRLAELKHNRRRAQDGTRPMSADESEELERLFDAEFAASAQRAAAVARELQR